MKVGVSNGPARRALRTGIVAVISVAFASIAHAADMSSAKDITAAVSGSTYQGSMLQSAFAEYYDPSGAIRGKGYSGKWRVAEGSMCFQYGEKPETCWGVVVDGPAMTLYKDGKIDGAGILVPGNPHKF